MFAGRSRRDPGVRAPKPRRSWNSSSASLIASRKSWLLAGYGAEPKTGLRMADTPLSETHKSRSFGRVLRGLRADLFGWGLVRLDISGQVIRPALRKGSKNLILRRLGLWTILVDPSSSQMSQQRKWVRLGRVARPEPLLLPLPSELFRVSVRVSELEGAVTLRLAAASSEGEARGSAPLPIAPLQRDWFVRAPLSETIGELALLTAGPARLGRLDIRVIPVSAPSRRLLGRQPEEAISVLKTAEIVTPVKRLYRAGRYQEVLALQADTGLQVEPVNRLAFASYVALRRFEDALRFHEQWSPEDNAPSWEGRKLEAMANLGEWEAIGLRIARHLTGPPTADRARLLLLGLPYLATKPALQRRVLEAVAAKPSLTPLGDAAAVDAANRMIFADGLPNKAAFTTHVQSGASKAEKFLLQSNAALKDGACLSQLDSLNQALAEFDLDPVTSAKPGEALSVSALRCVARTVNADGPVVSVIMTAFNSGSTIGYALHSLLSQTHAALEIIVVDDASTDDTASIVEALAGQDPRLRLLRQSKNCGTYKSRNTALGVVSGKLITNHDSDDWAHPRKIERLLKAMRPNDVAAWGCALRLTPDVGFLSRGGFINMEAASLMFERDVVLDAIGGYDEVRAGGDGEFQRRLERRFGLERVAVCPAPLSIMSVRSNSLSRSGRYAIDDRSGVFSAERNAYRRRYLERLADPSTLSNPDPRQTNGDAHRL